MAHVSVHTDVAGSLLNRHANANAALTALIAANADPLAIAREKSHRERLAREIARSVNVEDILGVIR